MKIPDWFIYLIILAVIFGVVIRQDGELDAPPSPPELGPPLAAPLPSDQVVIVEIGDPTSGVGTAFAIDENGNWLTARHVIDGCDRVGIVASGGKGVEARNVEMSLNSDLAIIRTGWRRPPLKLDLETTRSVGEYGYFIGYPQGRPGEVVGSLMGRGRMAVRGRYRTTENILTWAELGRTRNLDGSLGGISGAPAFDSDGEVIGVVAAESPRRGRVYTVAPRVVDMLIDPDPDGTADPIYSDRYDRSADKLRRDRRVAQVWCQVD